MKMSAKKIGFAVVLVGLTLALTMAYAADEQAAPRGDRGERGQRGGFNRDPEQMQKMMLEGVKKQLAATDEEWTVIEPRLSKVMKLSNSTRFGGLRAMMGGMGPMGGQRNESGTEKSAIEKAAEELQSVLKNEKSTEDEVKAKLAALRSEKEKAQSELITAKEELLKVLSLNQEASLVIMGLLD